MALNTDNPTTYTSLLVGESNNLGQAPNWTTVNGLKAAAIADFQATSGGMLIVRMTTAQISALTNVAEGTMLFNTDLQQLGVFTEGGWSYSTNQLNTGEVLVSRVAVSNAQMLDLIANPVTLVAAPGANHIIVPWRATITKTTGNAYDVTGADDLAITGAGAAKNIASITLPLIDKDTFLATTTAEMVYVVQADVSPLNPTVTENVALVLCQTAGTTDYTVGDNENLVVTVYYTVISVI